MVYRCFDTTLDIDFPVALDVADPPGRCVVRRREVPQDVIPSFRLPRELSRPAWFELSAGPDWWHVKLAGVGTFVLDDLGVGYESLTSPDRFRSFFFRLILPLWLERQGVTVLHAGAVQVGGRAVVYLADSGVGKSTLTLMLLALGAKFISDDQVPVRIEGGAIRVCPAVPWLKAWPDAVSNAGLSPEAFPLLEAGAEKRLIQVPAAGRVSTPVIMAEMFLLTRASTDEVEVKKRGETAQTLLRLAASSPVPRALAATPRAAARLSDLTTMAEVVGVQELKIPARLSGVREAAALIVSRLSARADEPPDSDWFERWRREVTPS